MGGELVVSNPWIGPEMELWRIALCCYSSAPGEPHCTRDATWHAVKIEPDCLAMPSCDEHKPIAETLADYVHPYVHPCGIPGSEFCWPENECRLDWDERSEFAQVAESAGVS